MAVYKIERTQHLPISVEEAWKFFSSPKNLDEITPPDMSFRITSDNGDEPIHAGQIITYKVAPVLNIPMFWMTEITHVKDLEFFVDEQRFGPYAFWHHRHYFRPTAEGVEMKDIVYYKLPLGILGDLAHAIFVKKKLRKIFDYRYALLEKRFPR